MDGPSRGEDLHEGFPNTRKQDATQDWKAPRLMIIFFSDFPSMLVWSTPLKSLPTPPPSVGNAP